MPLTPNRAILEIAEFAALLARQCPNASRGQIAHAVAVLIRQARKLHRLAEKACNSLHTERDARAWIVATSASVAICEMLGVPCKVISNGDPRGYVLRLRFDDGTHNTWGGEEEGYGVPTAD